MHVTRFCLFRSDFNIKNIMCKGKDKRADTDINQPTISKNNTDTIHVGFFFQFQSLIGLYLVLE